MREVPKGHEVEGRGVTGKPPGRGIVYGDFSYGRGGGRSLITALTRPTNLGWKGG